VIGHRKKKKPLSRERWGILIGIAEREEEGHLPGGVSSSRKGATWTGRESSGSTRKRHLRTSWDALQESQKEREVPPHPKEPRNALQKTLTGRAKSMANKKVVIGLYPEIDLRAALG